MTRSILHLSIPVRDLSEARDFYVRTLGCKAARAREDFCDVWFHGMQVTLQHRPDEAARAAGAAAEAASCRHFGVTLGREEFDAAVALVDESAAPWIVPPATDHRGQPTEQTKAKLADPSGNVIELKTYRDTKAALEISFEPDPAEGS